MSRHDTVHIVLNTFRGEDEMKMNEATAIFQDNGNYLGPATKCDIAEDSNIHLLH